MNDRIIQAISKLKERQDELGFDLKQLAKEFEKSSSLNMQEAILRVADDLARYTIKDGNWYYNGKDTGIKAEGIDGKDGIQGPQGIPGKDGKDGKPGKDGKNGKDGKDGKPGLNGKDGKPGKDGKNGIDGKDGITPLIKIGKVESSDTYGGANVKMRFGKGNIIYLDFTLPMGRQGFAGLDGKDAKINGKNTIDIVAGDNITIEQEDDKLVINSEGGSGGNNKMDKVNPTGTGKLQINGSATGNNSVALGTNVTAHGANSLIQGTSDNKALDVTTVSKIAQATDVNNPNSANLLSDWEYNKFSLAGGESSFVQGNNSLALGTNSIALGNGTIAEKSSAFACGTGSHASGKYSFAGGLETLASNQGSIAIGQRVKATGHSSIALGYNESNFEDNNATGVRSIAVGYETKATAEDAVAIGKRLLATAVNQFVVGKYNEETENTLFVVGNGQGTASRSNALEVTVDGKAHISGTLSSDDDDTTLINMKYLKDYIDDYLPVGKYLNNATAVNNAKDAGLYNVKFKYDLGGGDSCYGEMLVIPYVSQSGGNRVDYGAQLFFPNGDETNKNCFWYRTINRNSWNSWVKVDPSVYAKTNQNNNFSTAQTINGTLTVNGDIVQNGQSYETHAEQLFTKNDIIKTRDGAVGGLGSNEVTGIEAIKYDGTNNGRLVFDNTGTAKVGDVGDEVPLLARDEVANLTNEQVLVWDSTNLIAKGSSDYVKNTDYATSNNAGIVKSGSGFLVNSSGVPSASNWDYSTYTSYASSIFIGKGTLEAVFTGKKFAPMETLTQSEYDALVSGGTVDSNTYYFIEEE